MESINSGHYALRYIVEGKGPSALVVGSALYYSRVFSQSLRQHLRLAFVDHRGFGRAKVAPQVEDFALDVLLDDMEAMRQRLNLGRVIVIGHSGHGYLALEYAKRYPQHVSNVVVICTGPNHSAESHAAADAALRAHGGAQRQALLAERLAGLGADIARDPQRAFVTYCLAQGPRTWADPHFDAAPLWEGVEVNMLMFDEVFGKVFRDIDVTHHAERLTAPVLLVMGRQDFLVAPLESWAPYVPAFKAWTSVLLENCGHTPPLETPEAFDRTLLQWLNLGSSPLHTTC